jgi:hypothetical protein
MQPKLITSEEWVPNFNSWNPFHNHFNLKCIDHDAKYPKYLLIRAWQWFKEECEDYHIDWKYYQWVTITKGEVTWCIEFWDNPEGKDGNIGLYEIYYDSRDKKILQCVFSVN